MSFNESELEVVDRLLATTRSVRRRLDVTREVPRELVMDCIRLALQAPTASNLQTWRFIVVTDPGLRSKLGDIYRKTYAAAEAPLQYVQANRSQFERIEADQMTEVLGSAQHLVSVIEQIPLIIIPCVEGRLDEPIARPLAASLYGSIFPAIWSLQLALRSRGLGSSVTTSHLWYADEVAELLGIPDGVEQVALLPVAYYTGETFHPADRLPVENVVHWDTWDADLQQTRPADDVAAERVRRALESMSRLFTPPDDSRSMMKGADRG
jgi:nitroreductase